MHNIQLMTTSFTGPGSDSVNVDLLVIDIDGGDLNRLRDAHEMAGKMADKLEGFNGSASMTIVREERARAFCNLPHEIDAAMEQGDIEAVRNWLESDRCLSHERTLESNTMEVMSNLQGSVTFSFKEKFMVDIKAAGTIPVNGMTEIIFWGSHAVGDAVTGLPNGWLGVVTEAEKAEEELSEYEVPVCRTSYSKPKMISVMARNQKEANAKALEDAGNHEFRENSSEYSLGSGAH